MNTICDLIYHHYCSSLARDVVLLHQPPDKLCRGREEAGAADGRG